MAKTDFAISLKLIQDKFQSGLNQASNSLKNFKNMLMSAFGAFSLAGITKQLVDIGSGFDSAMAKVKAVSNATQTEFKAMEDEAQRLGATTAYSASEAAGALENLVRNGLKPSQATKALAGTLQLAQSQCIELSEAADLATVAMNAFGLQVSDLGRINDVMASTASHSATNVTDLGEAFKIAGPIAKAAGMSLEETYAMLGELANQGYRGTDAGTGIKQMITAIAKQTPQARAELAKYGISVSEADIKTKGLNATLKEMADKGLFNNIEAVATIFGKMAAPKALALGTNTDATADLNNTLNNSQGEAARMASQSLGDFEGSWKSFKSAVESTIIGIWQKLKGVFKGPVDALTYFVRNLTDIPRLVLPVFALLYSRISSLARSSSEKTIASIKNEYTPKIANEQALSQRVTNYSNAAGLLKIDETPTINQLKTLQKRLTELYPEFQMNNEQLELYNAAMKQLGIALDTATTDQAAFNAALYETQGNLEALTVVSDAEAKSLTARMNTQIAQTQTVGGKFKSVWSTIGNGFKSLGNSILSFFGGVQGLIVTASLLIGEHFVNAWQDMTEAVRTSKKIMEDCNNEIENTNRETNMLIGMLQRTEKGTKAYDDTLAKLGQTMPEIAQLIKDQGLDVHSTASEWRKCGDAVQYYMASLRALKRQEAYQKIVETYGEAAGNSLGGLSDFKGAIRKVNPNASDEEIKEIAREIVDLKAGIKTANTSAKYSSGAAAEAYKKSAESQKKELDNLLNKYNLKGEFFSKWSFSESSTDPNAIGVAELNTYNLDEALNNNIVSSSLTLNYKHLASAMESLNDATDWYLALAEKGSKNPKEPKGNPLDGGGGGGDSNTNKNKNKVKIDKTTEDKYKEIYDDYMKSLLVAEAKNKKGLFKTVQDYKEAIKSIEESFISSVEGLKDVKLLDSEGYANAQNNVAKLTDEIEKLSKATQKAKEEEEKRVELAKRALDLTTRQMDWENKYGFKKDEKHPNGYLSNINAEKPVYEQVQDFWKYFTTSTNMKKAVTNPNMNDKDTVQYILQQTSDYYHRQYDAIRQRMQELGVNDADLEGYIKRYQADKANIENFINGREYTPKYQQESSVEGSKITGTFAKGLDIPDVQIKAFRDLKDGEQDIYSLAKAITELGVSLNDLDVMAAGADNGLAMLDAAAKRDEAFVERGNAITKFAKSSINDINNVYQAFDSLDEKWDDMSGFERFMAIVNAIEAVGTAIDNTVECFTTLLSSIKAYNNAQSNLATVAASSSAAITAANASNAATTAAAAGTELAASTASGTGAAVASAAKLQFPANIIAMAGALTSALAIFAQIPKFATGGNVGDNNLVAMNGNEMILNQRQQRKLFNALNGNGSTGGGTTGGNVTFTIKGKDLQGTLDNYNNRKSKLK